MPRTLHEIVDAVARIIRSEKSAGEHFAEDYFALFIESYRSPDRITADRLLGLLATRLDMDLEETRKRVGQVHVRWQHWEELFAKVLPAGRSRNVGSDS
jgi:hypothetical protein